MKRLQRQQVMMIIKQDTITREQKEKVQDALARLNLNELEDYTEERLRLLGVDPGSIKIIMAAGETLSSMRD